MKKIIAVIKPEDWRPIPGIASRYRIDRHGRLISIVGDNIHGFKASLTRSGNLNYCVQINDDYPHKHWTFSVVRLVAAAWLGTDLYEDEVYSCNDKKTVIRLDKIVIVRGTRNKSPMRNGPIAKIDVNGITLETYKSIR